MKFYPSFKENDLVLVGAGIFPWLRRERWILGKTLEGSIKRWGKNKQVNYPRSKLHFSYNGSKLKVMGHLVIATTLVSHQLHEWIKQWIQE